MFYHKLGKIPSKRHIQFRKKNNELYSEELVSSKGFSGVYSNLYHHYIPTRIEELGKSEDFGWELSVDKDLKPRHLNTSNFGKTGSDFIQGRKYLMVNNDLAIAICNPQNLTMDYYYKNGECDEIVFVHEGKGILHTQLGRIEFNRWDYLVIPRTIVYKIEFLEESRLLVVESNTPVETPKRYRNELGQLLEHSPYCERDIRPPVSLETQTEKGKFEVQVKKLGRLHKFIYHTSPFDVEGWDGFLWPYAFNILDFEPLTGRIHQPPPIHQTFEAWNFVICSFVPRLFDYHPLAIPAPYNHSNIDSDEVLFYTDGDFMSRKGIDRGSFTLHPGGIPHGPHPGTVEKSIGAKDTKELAVMIDTFKPLFLTKDAESFVDQGYPFSWQE